MKKLIALSFIVSSASAAQQKYISIDLENKTPNIIRAVLAKSNFRKNCRTKSGKRAQLCESTGIQARQTTSLKILRPSKVGLHPKKAKLALYADKKRLAHKTVSDGSKVTIKLTKKAEKEYFNTKHITLTKKNVKISVASKWRQKLPGGKNKERSQ